MNTVLVRECRLREPILEMAGMWPIDRRIAYRVSRATGASAPVAATGRGVVVHASAAINVCAFQLSRLSRRSTVHRPVPHTNGNGHSRKSVDHKRLGQRDLKVGPLGGSVGSRLSITYMSTLTVAYAHAYLHV